MTPCMDILKIYSLRTIHPPTTFQNKGTACHELVSIGQPDKDQLKPPTCSDPFQDNMAVHQDPGTLVSTPKVTGIAFVGMFVCSFVGLLILTHRHIQVLAQ